MLLVGSRLLLGVSRALLGVFWAPLGRSCAPLGRIWVRQGAPRFDFKGLWVPPNHVLGCSGTILGSGFGYNALFLHEAQHGFHIRFSFSPCSAAVRAQHMELKRQGSWFMENSIVDVLSFQKFEKHEKLINRNFRNFVHRTYLFGVSRFWKKNNADISSVFHNFTPRQKVVES